MTAAKSGSTGLAIAKVTLVSTVCASIINLGVSAAARGAGASDQFQALKPASFIFFTLIGTLIGAVGWNLIRAKSQQPSRLLNRLVPMVLLASFIPDVAVGVTDSPSGADWTGAIGLMVMHVVVATSAVLAYRRWLAVTK